MFWQKKEFGQRKATQDDRKQDSVKQNIRVFDQSLWHGERAEVLRHLGHAPDDPKNVLASQDPVSVQLARDDAALTHVLRTLNDASPYPIGAFTLLREELWQGRFGAFLLQRLDLRFALGT